MPLYAYRCDNCGVEFERTQKFADKPIKRCPECNKSAARRVIQTSGIVFKGSGWYKTDSRSASSATLTSDSASKKKDGKEAKESKETKEVKESKKSAKSESSPASSSSAEE